MLINDFVDAMQKKDYVALSRCFADHCQVYDYCPSCVGKANSYVYGASAVEMFYHNKFVLDGLSLTHPDVETPESANFYISYGGFYMHATACIEKFDRKSRLISVMVIRPA